jgi:hypothetical protein
MLENEKERGRSIVRMPPPARNGLIARMMFGEAAEQAQGGMFMLMGMWGVAPGPPPGAGGPGGGPGQAGPPGAAPEGPGGPPAAGRPPEVEGGAT